MKNLGVVITDGVGFRNFILTDFIKESKNNCDKVVIFSCLPKFVYEGYVEDCEIIELEVFNENFVTWFLRKSKEVAHLQLHRCSNFGIQDGFNTNNSKAHTTRGYATRFITKFTSIFNSEKWILRYNYWQQKSFKNNKITIDYSKILIENEISLLFFTHQRPPFIAPLIYAAEQVKIKTAAFIFSWDNLASKGRMAGNFNHYLVWSDLMKHELLQFYTSVKDENIAVVGTPQFEPFVMENFGYDKSRLISKFELNQDKYIILFTCNDSSSENDPLYLELLAQFITDKKLVKEVDLVVRTSPAEEPERFKSIIDKHPFIKWNFPDWKVKRDNHQENWTQRVPSKNDLDDLKSLLKHCDLNINVLSTITLDAFIFNKPVINPVFGNDYNGMFNDQKFLKYEHLSKLVDSNASWIVKNEEEYLNAINKILKNEDDKENARVQFNQLQIGKTLKGTSNRIAETLLKWM